MYQSNSMNKAAQLFHQVLDETPESLKTQVQLSFEVSDRIDALLKQKGMTQKELARLTHTSEAAVSKWLSGTHNFTFSTIGKISAVLGAPIINVASSTNNGYCWYGQSAQSPLVIKPVCHFSNFLNSSFWGRTFSNSSSISSAVL